MIASEEIRKCVAFVGLRLADGSHKLAGSGFFLGSGQHGNNTTSVWFVTARHVIDGIRSKLLTEVWLRLNLKDGTAVWVESKLDDWFSHPTDKSIDVAMVACGIPDEFDHLVIPFSLCGTEENMRKHEVGLGDEVFITGLFRHYYGSRRNIPIVRVGNISCLIEEKIQTRDYGEIDAYLIEARSIGGLSGSPVFVNLGVVRMVGGKVMHAQNAPIFFLIGLIHGHFDAQASSVDANADNGDQGLTPERVNTGIAIVVPFQRIQEVCKLMDARRAEQPTTP